MRLTAALLTVPLLAQPSLAQAQSTTPVRVVNPLGTRACEYQFATKDDLTGENRFVAIGMNSADFNVTITTREGLQPIDASGSIASPSLNGEKFFANTSSWSSGREGGFALSGSAYHVVKMLLDGGKLEVGALTREERRKLTITSPFYTAGPSAKVTLPNLRPRIAEMEACIAANYRITQTEFCIHNEICDQDRWVALHADRNMVILGELSGKKEPLGGTDDEVLLTVYAEPRPAPSNNAYYQSIYAEGKISCDTISFQQSYAVPMVQYPHLPIPVATPAMPPSNAQAIKSAVANFCSLKFHSRLLRGSGLKTAITFLQYFDSEYPPASEIARRAAKIKK